MAKNKIKKEDVLKERKLTVDINWDPRFELQDSKLIEMATFLETSPLWENPLLNYNGVVNDSKLVQPYIHILDVYTPRSCNGKEFFKNIILEKPGIKRYESRFAMSDNDKDLASMLWLMKVAGKKHFLITRNEWVSTADYCAFFGSGSWGGDFAYSRGDFVETLRQIAFDLMHNEPEIYPWEHVPQYLSLPKSVRENPQSHNFVISIVKPLDKEARETSDLAKKASLYLQIADKTERFVNETKLDFGLTRK